MWCRWSAWGIFEKCWRIDEIDECWLWLIQTFDRFPFIFDVWFVCWTFDPIYVHLNVNGFAKLHQTDRLAQFVLILFNRIWACFLLFLPQMNQIIIIIIFIIILLLFGFLFGMRKVKAEKTAIIACVVASNNQTKRNLYSKHKSVRVVKWRKKNTSNIKKKKKTNMERSRPK